MENEVAVVAAAAVALSDGDEVGTTASAGSSPKNRVKFLCSHGGKIMPRPADGILKYVGGETRIIAVPRDINFAELTKKLKAEFEGDMILKYQVIPEDLDVLVSVRTDEDLKHMVDEYDRHENEGTAKLRAFLFPATASPLVTDNHTASSVDPLAGQQRYIDAINGTFRATPNFKLAPISANRPTFSISACSSPNCHSPESNASDSVSHDPSFVSGYHNNRLPMHKVHSSPSLYSLNNPQHQSNNLSHHQYYQHHHNHYCQHHQHHHPLPYQPPRPIPDPHRIAPALSFGRQDFGRAPVSIPLNQYSSIRNNLGSGESKHGYYDEHSAHGCRTPERLDSVPPSPRGKTLERACVNW